MVHLSPQNLDALHGRRLRLAEAASGLATAEALFRHGAAPVLLVQSPPQLEQQLDLHAVHHQSVHFNQRLQRPGQLVQPLNPGML